jgi:hypothetical protein
MCMLELILDKLSGVLYKYGVGGSRLKAQSLRPKA